MTSNTARRLLVGNLCLAFWPALASAQGGCWERYMAEGTEAYQQGDDLEGVIPVVGRRG